MVWVRGQDIVTVTSFLKITLPLPYNGTRFCVPSSSSTEVHACLYYGRYGLDKVLEERRDGGMEGQRKGQMEGVQTYSLRVVPTLTDVQVSKCCETRLCICTFQTQLNMAIRSG